MLESGSNLDPVAGLCKGGNASPGSLKPFI